MGMKVELVRTDEENERYRKLVETNRRRRRQLIQQEQQQKQIENQSIIPRVNYFISLVKITNCVDNHLENQIPLL
jgi:transposase